MLILDFKACWANVAPLGSSLTLSLYHVVKKNREKMPNSCGIGVTRPNVEKNRPISMFAERKASHLNSQAVGMD